MASEDPSVKDHLEWLGYVRPTGLVVSALALVRAGAILPQRDSEGQRLLRACVRDEGSPRIQDFRAFAEAVLGWRFSPKGYAGTPQCPIPDELTLALPDYGLVLRPDYAVREPDPSQAGSPWQLLVMLCPDGEDLDRAQSRHELPPHSRMERLLRDKGVPAGLLVNGETLRLISAPRGESSGWLDFRVADMVQTAGRPICSALRLLLSEQRLLALPRNQRLAALLAESRKYQNEVSERLSEQVLDALYDLLRGFQAAHDASGGLLLAGPLREDPNEVYRGLLTVILRLVFLLYAEERGLLPTDHPAFQSSYSFAAPYERLREDAAFYPDTMDQRFFAFPQLLALFRMLHDGASAPGFRLPPRRGGLFDPDRYPFLEGRDQVRQARERIAPPLVSDATVYRVLDKLLILDGERLSYRALDVEQIGSVYETMMGFRLQTATGPSLAIRPVKRHGAPSIIALDALLDVPPAHRGTWIKQHADRKISPSVERSLKQARTIEDLHAALQEIVDRRATPDLALPGAMVLEPSDERRRSGSHYTPRQLTEPIVRTTLAPVVDRLREHGRPPRPERILDLKVCDPAMGSGAFLVEACRFLADALVESWRAYACTPAIPPDEDEVTFARRLVAQRCLYGVDRNPVAVDLAKMSLWLATLAKDHPLTFLDHALRHGDSLVGLTRRQLREFHWAPEASRRAKAFRGDLFEAVGARALLERVANLRRQIREAGEEVPDHVLRGLWREAEDALFKVRLVGDLAVLAFFEADKDPAREARRWEYATAVINDTYAQYVPLLAERRNAHPPLVPFHWEVEFPEVFERENPGFDAIIGNPPFAGKNSVAAGNVRGYPEWLQTIHEETHGNADLVAHFFRRAFALLRQGGTFGLIATNTIAQGDTRASGLRYICQHGGEVYHARRRVRWPGMAAVVVSVVHVRKGPHEGPKVLDGREVPKITAFLHHRGGHDDPARLAENAGKSFVGSYVLGMGFTFDDTDRKGVATPLRELVRLLTGTAQDLSISEIDALLRDHPRYREVIFPYIGGEEVNTSPTHAHHRYVIHFGDRSEEECRQRWPELMAIVEEKVRPERERIKDVFGRTYWWRFMRIRPELHAAIAGLERVLAISQVTHHVQFAFLPSAMTYSHRLYVFTLAENGGFAVLQSRVHEIWARFLGSTLRDDFMYASEDCFETFPFPEGWQEHPALEARGREYYEFRAALMRRNQQGLTETYNRFHDPYEQDPDISRLRELHAAMDQAVLDAYGWSDLPTNCDFYPDYEVEEKEGRKPYRYRWPDEVQDEVLARLLELNAARAKAGSSPKAPARPNRRTQTPKPEDLL